MNQNRHKGYYCMETHLSETLDLAEAKAKYDTCVKEILADKQVLARILKYTLEEFSDYEPDDIIKCMDEPVISGIRIEPGYSNANAVHRLSEVDDVYGEGKIYYDIRFSVYHDGKQIKILINIEAQRSTSPSKLGYRLDNRIMYYLARMVSAQKGTEFEHSDYDSIKAVRSIWICMDSADDEDSINRIRFTQETVYGKEMELKNIDKVQGIIIRLRKNENAGESRHTLIAMLEELLRNEDTAKKKVKLANEYSLVMGVDTEGRVNTMCNLSEVVLERGIEKGCARGIVELGCDIGLTEEDILRRLTEKLDISDEKALEYIELYRTM